MQSVPIIMHHSVGIPDKQWRWNHLTCPYDIFDNQLKWLNKLQFSTITLEDLYQYVYNKKKIPDRSIIITFDDGYADNWVFAFPILKKYGMKATVFVNPEFIDPRPIVRKRLDEEPKIDQLDWKGFLSWEELRLMESKRIFDVQSHALTHTWYPISDKIIDFRHPNDNYFWMTWNQNVLKKPFLQKDDAKYIKYGEPVYEFDKSLSNKQFFPDKCISEVLVEHVKKNGGESFFNDSSWKNILFDVAAKFTKENNLRGHLETETEYEERIYFELSKTKRIIEKEMNKKVEFHCWPGGSGSSIGREIARNLGYKMTTVARDIIKSERKKICNSPKTRLDYFSRFGPILYHDGKEEYGSNIIYAGGFILLLRILIKKRLLFSHYWGNALLVLLRTIH